MTKPLKPEEAVKSIDAKMIDTVNVMIKENLNGRVAKFTQNDLLDKYIELNLKELNENLAGTRDQIIADLFKRKQLDFEQIYRDLGWKVEYDKPAYNETYPATFEFRLKKKHLKTPKVAKKINALAASEA